MVWELKSREEAVMGRSTLLKLFLVPACVHTYICVCVCVCVCGRVGEAELVSEMNKSPSQ